MSSRFAGLGRYVRLGDQVPFTTVAIAGFSGDRFVVDSGNQFGFIVFDYFARTRPDALRGEIALSDGFVGTVSGAIRVQKYLLHDVKIGNVTFERFAANRTVDPGIFAGKVDGLIGVDELRLFTVWLDYPESTIVLVPNHTFLEAET